MGWRMVRNNDGIEIETIDHELRYPWWRLQFSPAVEINFQSAMVEPKARRLVITGLLAIFVDLAFLQTDYQLMSDVFIYYLIARVFVFTPTVLIIIFLVHTNPQKWFSELVPSLVCIFLVALIMLIFTQSHSEHRPQYCYGVFLVMLYALVVQRMQIRYAFITSLVSLIIQFSCVYVSQFKDTTVFQSNITFFVAGTALLLIASYLLERSDRNVYLLNLRADLINQKLERAAMLDPLTSLGNRRQFEETTHNFWKQQSQSPATGSLILLDVDRFKLFNDRYGHLAGDQCLSKIADCIATNIRDQDLAVRFGGEEMIVFLPETDFSTAREIAEKLRGAVRRIAIPHGALGSDAVVTASFGVSSGLTSEVTPIDLISSADSALYAAKRSGRDQVWPPAIKTQAEHHIVLVSPEIKLACDPN